MFNPSSSSVPTYSDLSMHNAVNFSSDLHTAPTEIPRGNGFFHDNGGLFSPLGVAASAPPPYTSSLPSYYMNRSSSSHSFPLHLQFPEPLISNAAFSCPSPSAFQLPLPPVSSSPSSSSGDLLEFSSSDTMRRVLSTGDHFSHVLMQNRGTMFCYHHRYRRHFQVTTAARKQRASHSRRRWGDTAPKNGRRGSRGTAASASRGTSTRRSLYVLGTPLPHDLCKCIPVLSPVPVYHHLFFAAFQYACRKTLADSRPRVQGRFARNVETEGDAATDLEIEASDISYEHCSYNDLSGGGGCYDGQSQRRETGGDGMVFDDKNWWWWAAPVALAPNRQQQSVGFDVFGVDDEEQLWASLADMCSGT